MKNTMLSALISVCALLAMILDSQTALSGAREGLELCLRVVIPSLLPFLFLTTVFTDAMSGSPLHFLRPLGKLCGLPSGMECLFVPAFLGGYPAGAQCVAESYSSGALSRADAERMLCFCSNAGPAFIFGLSASLFSEQWIPWLLWGIQILSACTTAFLFRTDDLSTGLNVQRKCVSIPDSFSSSLKSMAYICGWVTIFRILISFLRRWILGSMPQQLQIAFIGLLELSNGCLAAAALKDCRQCIVLCSCLLSFGGFCVIMQTKSVLKDLSIRPYLMGKVVQTGLSFLFAWAFAYKAPLLLLPVLALAVTSQKKKITVAFTTKMMYNKHNI